MKKQFWRATLVMGGARIESEHESRLTDEEVFAHHKFATRPKNAMVEWIPFQKEVASAPVETAVPVETAMPPVPTKWHGLPDPAAIDWSKEFKDTLQNLLPKIDALRVAVERELSHRDELAGKLEAIKAAVGCDVSTMTLVEVIKLLGERGLIFNIREDTSG